ncbi:MAG: SRPBCC domain-containing protein [Rhizobiaceae bacterium]|nr:SRPBCC domain-containing protein [Rhizobiaceae bacterium]
MEDLELTVSRTIAAPRDKVFNAWLSPAMMAKFMRPSAGDRQARVTNDPKKGGSFEIVMVTAENREIPHTGTYLAIDPHSHLAFTWASPHSLDDSRVTIDFAERGPNETEVTLHQVKFRSEQARDGHVKGWTVILAELEKELA